ncbi:MULTISPECIES: BMP family ABC transporter substrate-binding protein [Thalassospira]|uniref:BMP family ABC transporter substrate-binding protein n=1 Tax=Thalassospira povalilytica TaxID=732237 RepID=A0A8I1M5K9_9PROT|nr:MULTISPECIES: BMP family ABC transporter substrate-binding protein [Thalassospira]MEE3044232.1 BMP family ABC transporter substrate-binding protein [Pseudomonadota bacterium]RCK26458.1 DNA-binding protein [Thalassospira profundimaris]MBN8195602.1 BMP family ABC transporter substrate-binding protein [Thalassospira povalilytica]MBO6770064.1 BMP family ABC transporter substrate-binding protein [Thalassospira sp.]MCC4239591.1 BMP family ABC transporter substrate-binding protein [Thalassospira p
MKRTIAAVAAVGALATGMGAAQAEDVKVGFVYVGPIGDHGWSYRHDIGRQAIEAELGAETSYVESVPEGADAERVIRQMAQTGHNLIFTTSFGYMNPTEKVAKQFPNVKFEHATGYKRADNLSTYAARFYEGRYVAGVIAGKMTKSNIVGYVGSFPIPEVVRGINSFMMGAWSVNPDVKVKIVWANTWYDPGKEGDAAKALIDQGADIMVQHTDSPAPLQVAENRGVLGFGQASDMIKFAPKAQLTAIVDNWDSYYVARAKAVADGTWESMDTWGGINTGMVELAPYTNMPDDVKALAEETAAKIASGEFHPFTGPIYDQAGELRVKEGEVADDGMLLGMDWYIKGIDAELPK